MHSKRRSTSSSMRREIVTAAIAMLMFTVLLGVVYPLAVTGVGQVLFPGDANGSQIHVKGRLIGSKLIGQRFAEVVIGKDGKPQEEEGALVTKPDPSYFQGRPSATEPPYDAAASAFSNLGPNSRLTREGDVERIEEYLALNRPYDPGLTVAQIPVDAINTSASDLDPEISVANADIQAHRVAAVRHLPPSRVMALIAKHTKARELGLLGEPAVNVLELNLALDEATKGG